MENRPANVKIIVITCLHKEQNGYVLNSLLIPLLSAAAKLFFFGVSDIKVPHFLK
jgi:hypothetical protein